MNVFLDKNTFGSLRVWRSSFIWMHFVCPGWTAILTLHGSGLIFWRTHLCSFLSPWVDQHDLVSFDACSLFFLFTSFAATFTSLRFYLHLPSLVALFLFAFRFLDQSLLFDFPSYFKPCSAYPKLFHSLLQNRISLLWDNCHLCLLSNLFGCQILAT